MKFQPATQTRQYINLAVFGPAGCGKTLMGLSAPGKKLVIDTEGGSLPYASLAKFEVMHTQSFGDIKSVVDDMISSPPSEETSLIIDSASLIWQGLQQSMLEKKMREKGLTAEDGTEKVQFALADWGILKRWNSDIFNGLMAVKAHKVCTFRENEVMDEHTFKKTGIFVPQWEKNTPYIFDFVGRIHDRKFTFTKGRMAKDGKVIDLVGKSVPIPTIENGADLPKLWSALFGVSNDKPQEARPLAPEAKPGTLEKDPDSIRIAKEIHAKLLPHAKISFEDFTLYLLDKKDAAGNPIAALSEDGKLHLSTMSPKALRFCVAVLSDPAKVMQLGAKINELKKGVK